MKNSMIAIRCLTATLPTLLVVACGTATGGGGGGGFMPAADTGQGGGNIVTDAGGTGGDVGGSVTDVSNSQDISVCVPACTNKECGDDGCGGNCGKCPAVAPNCSNLGKCAAADCVPQCSGGGCGDDGCGGKCACSGGAICVANVCQAPCNESQNICNGDSLYGCSGKTGQMTVIPCTDALCIANGFKAGAGCGFAKNTGLNSCLCKSCVDECTSDVCVNGQVVQCSQGTDGCKKKLAPTDCKGGDICPSGGSGCVFCIDSDQCASDQVCSWDTGCTYYGGVKYNIVIGTVTFPVYNDGAGWDADGSAPEPKVCLTLDDVSLGCTSEGSNQLTMFYDESFTGTIWSWSKLTIEAYDTDSVYDDYGGGTYWETPNLLPLLKDGSFSGFIGSKGTKLTFTISPAFSG